MFVIRDIHCMDTCNLINIDAIGGSAVIQSENLKNVTTQWVSKVKNDKITFFPPTEREPGNNTEQANDNEAAKGCTH